MSRPVLFCRALSLHSRSRSEPSGLSPRQSWAHSGYAGWLLVMPLLTCGFGAEGYGIWVQLFIGAELLAGVAGLGPRGAQ